MKHFLQAFFSVSHPFFSGGLLLAWSSAGLPARADEGQGKNIVVLVDVSKSVDKTNQDSALKLVAGLIAGKVDDTVRAEWEFGHGDNSLAAVGNLRKLHAGEEGEPLAADEARFVVNPLGNYARVADLHQKLAQPGTGSPQEVANELLVPDKFAATDNSTHLTLAQAVAAEAFLRPASSGGGYYLIVISDGFEDCLNKEIKDYRDADLLAKLQNANERVFDGGERYADGGGVTGRYSEADQKAIRYLREETKGFDDNDELFVGRFTYKPQVTDPKKLPVRVLIYTPMVKPSLAFTESGGLKWILPDPTPVLGMKVNGVDGASEVKVTIKGPGGEKLWSAETRFDKIVSKNSLELGKLLELNGRKPFPHAGSYAIGLTVTQPDGFPPLPEVKADIKLIRPELRMDPKAAGTKAVGEKTIYEFPVNWEAREGIEVGFAPDAQPSVKCDLEVKFDGAEADSKATIRDGKGSIRVPDNMPQEKAGKEVELAVSLALPPTDEKLEEKVRLRFPKTAIWAEESKEMTVKGSHIELPKGGGRITFTANYEGCSGMDWAPTEVTGPDGKRVAAFGKRPVGERQKLDFSNAPPGDYIVKVAFGAPGASIPFDFTVKVPAGGMSWLLIAMIGMVVVGLSLFAWHFFRR